jgi:hypothetical protein
MSAARETISTGIFDSTLTPNSVPSHQNRRWMFLISATALLLALRFWHLRADFPSYAWYGQYHARFTDEGFYTGAAIQHFTLGQAYIPGGWNPGVFMPVWPLMSGILFHFTGISATAVRAMAVVCTCISVVLAYAIARQYRSSLFAARTAFLFAVSALGFFFSRLAILEPAFGMWLLLAIYMAGRVRARGYPMAVLVSIVFVIATLTKSTALFILPAVLWPAWAGNALNGNKDKKHAGRLVAAILLPIALLLGAAKIIWLLHYSADVSVLFSLRPLWQLEHAPLRLVRFFFRGTWIDPVLFPLAIACILAACTKLRFLWRDPFFVLALLWEAGYAAFIVFHYDGPPRYFVTLIVPTIWLALMLTEWLWRANRRVGIAITACIAGSVIWNVAMIGNVMARPTYRLADASLRIKQAIESEHHLHPETNTLLIGRGANEISLLAGGFPAMDSDGSMPLTEKIALYHPGWFMAWTNDPPQRTIFAAEQRDLVRRAFYPDLDPIQHAGIVLDQLIPKGQP